ncbi:HtaA domain-containing protein, partial [Patulibacter sp. S7RM1-6]
LAAKGVAAGAYGRIAVAADGAPSQAGTPAVPGWTSTVTAPAPAQPTPPATTPPPAAEEPIVSIGSTRWAFQTSFRNYVAGGDGNPPLQASAGATNDIAAGTFVFTATEGSYDPGTGTGRVVNRGRVVFDHPGHFFRITIADPTLVIEGDTGYLEAYGQAALYGTEGPGERVRMAELDLSGATRTITGRTVAIEGIAATLTADAAPLFGGFWNPGQPLDPISFSADVG